jgi:hypothetical protein
LDITDIIETGRHLAMLAFILLWDIIETGWIAFIAFKGELDTCITAFGYY